MANRENTNTTIVFDFESFEADWHNKVERDEETTTEELVEYFKSLRK